MSIDGIPTQNTPQPAPAHHAAPPRQSTEVPDLVAGPVIVNGYDPFTLVAAQWQFTPLRDEDGAIRMARVDWSPKPHPSSWLVSGTVTTVLPLASAKDLMIRVMKL